MQIKIKDTVRKEDYKKNLLALSFVVYIFDEESGDNYEHPYSLFNSELESPIEEIIKRETEIALIEAYKFFLNSPVKTNDVIKKDDALEALVFVVDAVDKTKVTIK